MTVTPERPLLPVLPMEGRTRGHRSPVTCHLRCGDACARPVPNTSDNPSFREVASAALSRRSVLRAGAAGTAVAVVGTALTASPSAAAPVEAVTTERSAERALRGSRLRFRAIAPPDADVDDVRTPPAYRWHTVIRWGDPVVRDAPVFDPQNPDPAAQATQFGYNCDYLDVLETNEAGTRGLLVANHEYTNENLMFPPDTDPETVIRCAWAAHGMSVVQVRRRRRGLPWEPVASNDNRRITLDTVFRIDGPAAGSDLLKTAEDPRGRRVRGTLNNCSGGTTPWGTVLSGEENFDQYFVAEGIDKTETRYGLGAADSRNWRSVEPRWDATSDDYRNEPNRFGWIVEVDPYSATSTPVKHTAMGRFKHEGANVIVNHDNHVVAYMGDDERFDYVYRFVSKDTYRNNPGGAARRHNMQLLSAGDLSVARFAGDGLGDGVSDGTGAWIPLTRDGESMVPGMSLEEVLVYTRLAADTVQPTMMDRPEDVEPNPHNGYIYVACTNNTERGVDGNEGPTEPNPRPVNREGHVVEIRPRGGDHTRDEFDWNLILICGDPDSAGTYFGGYEGPVSPISCPDNVAFDSVGSLWVSTDGQPGTLGSNDGLFKVPVEGAERGRVQQFLAVPAGAETCGPVIRDREASVLVAVQHPGEDGSWAEPQSYFPDYLRRRPGSSRRGRFSGPRPSVVHVTRR